MDDIDIRLLEMVQEGFPLVRSPFQALGESLGISESEVLERMERLKCDGLIRRIGPIMDLRKLGYSGVLVALQVLEEKADEVAEIVNEYEEVSHNYLRPNETGYNLWFTISAKEQRILAALEEIKSRTGMNQLILPTIRIFKIGVKFDIA
ncbi:MAG: Lrp/AsnC family transcriptional regulator [Methanotrichaceae archaeon]